MSLDGSVFVGSGLQAVCSGPLFLLRCQFKCYEHASFCTAVAALSPDFGEKCYCRNLTVTCKRVPCSEVHFWGLTSIAVSGSRNMPSSTVTFHSSSLCLRFFGERDNWRTLFRSIWLLTWVAWSARTLQPSPFLCCLRPCGSHMKA